MSFKGQLFFDPADIANIDSNLDSIGSYLIGGDKAILDKENDTASAGSDRGIGMLVVRKDSPTALAGTDGDYSFLQVDANGRLRVDAEVSVSTGSDKAEDSAHASGDIGAYVLAVRADSRPSNANTSADGDYASLFVNASGELWVKDADSLAELVLIKGVLDSIKVDTGNMDTSLNNIEASVASIDTSANNIEASVASIDTNVSDIENLISALSKSEDAAHASGDKGIMSLAVRNDSGAVLAGSDGDYIPFSTDASGNLRVAGTFTPTVPNSALENKVVSMSDTAAQIDASPLSSRKRIMIQNDGNNPVFIGKSDVTADTTAATGGLRLNKGATLEWDLGPGVAVYGVCETSKSSIIRLIEIA